MDVHWVAALVQADESPKLQNISVLTLGFVGQSSIKQKSVFINWNTVNAGSVRLPFD